MSVQFEHLEPRSETRVLGERVARLRSSMEWASEAIPRDVRDEVHATIERCDERLAMGVDFTVVALAGGTGSGKSSLFNALVGREFAVPGVARPTTAHVSAAVWGNRADALLDLADDGAGRDGSALAVQLGIARRLHARLECPVAAHRKGGGVA